MPDLFAIACTTCKTRLRVRDVAVIGQILACPQCSSMVLVEAPAGWTPPVADAAPTTTPTASSGSVIAKRPPVPTAKSSPASTPPPSPPAHVSPAHSSPAPTSPAVPAARALPIGADQSSLRETVSDSHFGEVNAILGEVGPTATAAKPTPAKPAGPQVEKNEKRRNSPTPSTTPAIAAVSASPSPALPPPPPLRAETDWTSTRLKRTRRIAMLAVGGCMGVALAIGAAFLARSVGREAEEVVKVDPQQRETPVAVVEPKKPDEVEPIPPEESEIAPPAENTGDVVPPTVPVTPDEPPPQKSGDPLEIVDDVPPEPGDAAHDPLQLAKLREQLAKLGAADDPLLPEPGSAIDSSEEPPAIDASPPLESRPRPEVKKINVTARLNDRLLEIDLTGQPLVEVLQVLSGMSTIPITLDPDALAWSKATPSKPIALKLKDKSLLEVLTEVAKAVRLEPLVVGDQVLITRSSAIRSIKCQVDDLTGGDAAKQKQLIANVEALASPSSWKSAGGKGSISLDGANLLIENTEMVYGEVLQVCERLRLARGGRTKSAFPPELFALERRTQRAAAKLDLPLTLNFSQSTPLVVILARLAEETGTHLLVDWQAAAESGWPPDCDATVTLENTPLREALTKLLGPMDLTYRVVDGNTFQVTTPQALEQHAEIEVYQVAELVGTPEETAAMLERITTALPQAVLRFDSASKSLLVLLSQPQHARLATLLDDWRN